MDKLKINYIDDETVKITYGREELAYLTHDDDGWAGMESVEAALRKFAKCLGVEVVED